MHANPADPLILVVEDDVNDQVFIERALRRSGVANSLRMVNNGEEAASYLSGGGEWSDRAAHPCPRMIITDLKMPKMGGIDLLEWMSGQSHLQHVPAIVLTSSSEQADISAAFRHGAKGYMIKPVQFGELEKLVRIVVDYWRASCVPPPREG